MALLLINAGATVTVCNSRTRDLKFHTSRANTPAFNKPIRKPARLDYGFES